MKKLIAFFLSVVMCLSLCCTAFASDNTLNTEDDMFSPNLEALFAEATTVDGAYGEMTAMKLVNAFDNDPIGFIKALSASPAEQIEIVTSLLGYGKSYGDIDAFEAEVSQMVNDQLFADYAFVLTSILDSVAYIQFLNEVDLSDDATVDVSNAFDPETILNFIELNEASGNVDEEYFHILGEAYRSDPILFAETVSERDDESIEYIAKAVAYDCLNNDDLAEFTEITSATLDAKVNNSVLDTIAVALADEANRNIEAFSNETAASADSSISLYSTVVPTIGTMTYSTAPLEVGSAETLKVTYTESKSTSMARTYWTEIYCIRNGVSWLKASKSVTIPAGSTSTTASYSMSFSEVGNVYTVVKVYSTSGGTLLTSRQGTYPDTVYGKWKITISLPVNRKNKGTLTLYNASGTNVMSCECLGLSQYNTAMNVTNGNTPTGTYTGYLAGPHSNTSSYGPYKYVSMTGVSGIIVTSGRSGIWIHGGTIADTSAATYPLRPTNGCVRISNSNQLKLQNNIVTLTSDGHNSTGNITISQS